MHGQEKTPIVPETTNTWPRLKVALVAAVWAAWCVVLIAGVAYFTL